MSDAWIVVPNWLRFQHYANRNPRWVKVYLELLHDHSFLDLSFHQRGVLLGIWLEYAASRGQLPGNTAALSRQLGDRVTTATLKRLSEAGFIDIVASRPLALCLPREEEKKNSPNPSQSEGLKRNRLNGYTGCRLVRGSHGASYVQDVLGRDKPPANWPYESPSRAQVREALEVA